MDKKTIVFDFDGVIHRYSKGWSDGTIDFERLDEVLLEIPAPIKVYDNSTLTADEIRKLKYIRNQKDYLER